MLNPKEPVVNTFRGNASNSAAGGVRLRRTLEERSRIQAARTQGFSLPASEHDGQVLAVHLLPGKRGSGLVRLTMAGPRPQVR